MYKDSIYLHRQTGQKVKIVQATKQLVTFKLKDGTQLTLTATNFNKHYHADLIKRRGFII